MTTTTRRFMMLKPLTFPLDLHAGPGAAYRRADAGDEIEIDVVRAQEFDRFLRGRIRGGDMVELDPVANMSAAAKEG